MGWGKEEFFANEEIEVVTKGRREAFFTNEEIEVLPGWPGGGAKK